MGGIIDYKYYVVTWKRDSSVRHYPLDILSPKFNSQGDDYLLFLKFDYQHKLPNFDLFIDSLEFLNNQFQNTFVILTPRKNAPEYTAREDEYVYSFSCKINNFKKLVGALNNIALSSANLLFNLLNQIKKDNCGIENLLIRQLPFEIEARKPVINCDVIIPHRGGDNDLRNLLSFLNHIKGLKIYAGIDQDITNEIVELTLNYPSMSFYKFAPNPVGPYVIRNKLIDQSFNEMIFFQDSDDIPCADRFGKISKFIANTGCQLCGSHELRLDYYNKSVLAVRFPINVMEALSNAPWHALLHPSSAITRDAFYKCGKLSEERTFGNDTKFLLYSFFKLTDIKNIDEFLYIRVKRPGSLTTSPDTMLGSPARQELLHKWNYDFEFIKYGRLLLTDSNLTPESSMIKFTVEKL